MAYGTRATFEELKEIEFGDVSGTFATVGSPIGVHARILICNNALNQSVYLSFDGTTNHLRLAPNSYKLIDFSSNKIRDDGLFLASGTQVWIKEVSSSVSSGTFWIETISAEGGK